MQQFRKVKVRGVVYNYIDDPDDKPVCSLVGWVEGGLPGVYWDESLDNSVTYFTETKQELACIKIGDLIFDEGKVLEIGSMEDLTLDVKIPARPRI